MDLHLWDKEIDFFNSEEEEFIVGTDEAGRGPLAGPVVASSVILSKDFPIEILNDSKKLSEKKREIIEKVIKEKALCYSVKRIEPVEIDKINILNASLKAMKESYLEVKNKFKGKIKILLCDGNKTPELEDNVEAIVKGDSKIPEIMAASILAKTERDRIMREYAKLYPNYKFDKNFGYPTKEHYLAIEKYGITAIHRLSFNLYKIEKEKVKEKTLFDY